MNDRFTCRPTTGTTTTSRQRNVLALSARVAELEADAARWRYLRGEFYEAVIPHGGKLNGHRTAWIPRFVPLVPGEGIDAAIDAAMKGKA